MERYLTFPIAVNGEPLRGVIDTGASRSAIKKAIAVGLHLPLVGEVTGLGFSGTAEGVLFQVDTIQLADIVVHDLQIGSFDLSGIEAAVATDISFIIGTDLLTRVVVEIDFCRSMIRLAKHLEPAIDRTYTRCQVLMGAQRVPTISVELETLGSTTAHLDLGSNVVCSVSEEYADLHGLCRDRPVSTTLTVGVEGSAICKLVSLTSLSIGPYGLKNVPACIVPNWQHAAPVILGWPLFRTFDFALDLGRGNLLLRSSRERLAMPLLRDRAGIGVARRSDRLVIMHVAENSPAEAAGLAVGDEIFAINGQQVDETYPARSERQGERPAGTVLGLLLGNGEMISLRLRDYF
ncbi:MAG: aspartyl protease family protein [Sphingomonas sp.]|nr:aspartyl protease family protein [Sphingomonas sp.]